MDPLPTSPPPPPPPINRDGFEIAIICALKVEADAVSALFDNFYEDQYHRYGRAKGDKNSYTTGVIGHHNVVLAHLSGAGKVSAAVVARGLGFSFTGVRLALVVGICGGVPKGTDNVKEVILGDVIISNGAVQYDFGKQFPHKFSRKDTLNDNLSRQNIEIRTFLGKLATHHTRTHVTKRTRTHLRKLCVENGVDGALYSSSGEYMIYEPSYRYPGEDEDHLYESSYRHMHHSPTTCTICPKCESKDDDVCDEVRDSVCLELKCDQSRLVRRDRLQDVVKVTPWAPKPIIHLGVIATGDTVMKSGEHRDEIAAKEKVIAFEMEAAGVWEEIDCVIIKGVCDYADSHKNDKWHAHAAAAAAACTKAFLEMWVPSDIPSQPLSPPLPAKSSGSVSWQTSGVQKSEGDSATTSLSSSHSRPASDSRRFSGDQIRIGDDFRLSIEKGNQFLAKRDPQSASACFQRARAIWESTQTGAATAYVQVYNCLAACALQMTYAKKEHEKKNNWLNKVDEYTQKAYSKVLESDDPQDVPRVQLNKIIAQIRRDQLGSKDGKLHENQAKMRLKQLQGVTRDILWLCKNGYDANSLRGKADGWIQEIDSGKETLHYKS